VRPVLPESERDGATGFLVVLAGRAAAGSTNEGHRIYVRSETGDGGGAWPVRPAAAYGGAGHDAARRSQQASGYASSDQVLSVLVNNAKPGYRSCLGFLAVRIS